MKKSICRVFFVSMLIFMMLGSFNITVLKSNADNGNSSNSSDTRRRRRKIWNKFIKF